MVTLKEYSVVNFSISLLLTFGVNHQNLVVGDNVAARGYFLSYLFYLVIIVIVLLQFYLNIGVG